MLNAAPKAETVPRLAGLAGIAALILAQPLAAAVPATAGAKADPGKKKICKATTDTGTRLGGKSICRTAAEWAQVRAEARRVVERIQDDKIQQCRPPLC